MTDGPPFELLTANLDRGLEAGIKISGWTILTRKGPISNAAVLDEYIFP